MKNLSLAILLLLTTLFFSAPAFSQSPAGASPSGKPNLGMNIAAIRDWSTELPLVDAFKLSRVWTSQQQGAPFGQGPRLDLDADGWIQSLQPGAWAESPMFSYPEPGHYPPGDYTLLYEGKGRLEFVRTKAATIVSQAPGRIIVRVNPKLGGLFLKISEIDPKNYPRNIRFIMPGFEATYEKDPWHPDFLARLRGFTCIRFMEAVNVNNSSVVSWSQRAVLSDETYTRRGLPYELCLDLCNRLKADPWLCIPHQANDDYIENLAKLVKSNLAPDRKAYIEYSNELWNSIFTQSKFVAEQGQHLNFAEKPWEAGWRYTAYRSKQIFTIFERVFGSRDRFIRVLASQTGNTFVSEQILRFKDAHQSADVFAVAPYISLMPRPEHAKAIVALGVDGLLDRVEKESLSAAIAQIKRDKALAEKYNLKLVAYEAGQHLVGVAGAENDQALTNLFAQANRHPRMGEIYTQYFKAWAVNSGTMMALFNSVNSSSKHGSWGLMEYADQDPFTTPKMSATLKFAREQGQNVITPTP